MFEPDRDPSVVELGAFCAQPPETVWRALTDPELISEWLSPTRGFSADVDTTFIVEVAADPPAEMACQVTVAEPAEHLAYSWTDLRGDPPLRWLVDFRLHAQGRGTRILLTVSGFDIDDRRQKMARNAIERGWSNQVLPKLVSAATTLGER